MLSGHHSSITAFAPSLVRHHSLKWATKTISSNTISHLAPLSIRTKSRHVLQLQASQSPLSIIGGAAAKIAAANTDTLSTAALTTMFLLALQYCAQPPLTRRFLDGKANKKGVTMVEGEFLMRLRCQILNDLVVQFQFQSTHIFLLLSKEIVKMGLSAAFFLNCGELKG